MKNRLLKLSLFLFAVSLLMVSVSCRSSNQVERQLFEVKRDDITLTVSADGNLSLVSSRRLTFATSGTVTEIAVKEGERVSESQVLARLDTAPLELNIKTAEIAVSSAAIDLEIATDSYKKITYPYTYYTFAFGVPEALAAIASAQNNVESTRNLLTSELTVETLAEMNRQLDDADTSLNLAWEKLGRGQGDDVFLSGQLSVASFWTLRDAQLAMGKAQLALDKAQNDLKKAQDELPKTVIKAPFSGLISQANAKEGDKLSSADYASKVIFELVDPDRLELIATVDEVDIARVSIGQKATFTLDALPDITPEGEVTYISPTSRTEGGVVVYEIKISVDAWKYPAMKSGMTAKAEIVTDRREQTLIIPERVLYTSDKGETAVKVLVNGNVEERVIRRGIGDATQVEVLEGLKEGDTVVIERKPRAT
ncbi:MAG: efflux RND transporter periplasmic adaptor subunit [Chloroflexota bacterium]